MSKQNIYFFTSLNSLKPFLYTTCINSKKELLIFKFLRNKIECSHQKKTSSVSGLYDSTIQITFIIYLEIFLILSFFIAQDFVICIFGLKYYYSASKRQRGLSSLSCRPAESAMTINKLDVTPKAENSTFTTLHLCIQLKSSGLKIIIKPQFMKLDLKLL